MPIPVCRGRADRIQRVRNQRLTPKYGATVITNSKSI